MRHHKVEQAIAPEFTYEDYMLKNFGEDAGCSYTIPIINNNTGTYKRRNYENIHGLGIYGFVNPISLTNEYNKRYRNGEYSDTMDMLHTFYNRGTVDSRFIRDGRSLDMARRYGSQYLWDPFFYMLQRLDDYLYGDLTRYVDNKYNTMIQLNNQIKDNLSPDKANQVLETAFGPPTDAVNNGIHTAHNDIMAANGNIIIKNRIISIGTGDFNTVRNKAAIGLPHLFNTVTIQNKNINSQINNTENYLTTNDRNAGRLNETNGFYRGYYYYLFIIYYFLLSVAIILIVFKYKQGWQKLLPEIIMITFLVVLPYVMTSFEMYIINTIQYIVSFITTTPYRPPTDPSVDPTNDPNQFNSIDIKDDYAPNNTEVSQEKTPPSPMLFLQTITNYTVDYINSWLPSNKQVNKVDAVQF